MFYNKNAAFLQKTFFMQYSTDNVNYILITFEICISFHDSLFGYVVTSIDLFGFASLACQFDLLDRCSTKISLNDAGVG